MTKVEPQPVSLDFGERWQHDFCANGTRSRTPFGRRQRGIAQW